MKRLTDKQSHIYEYICQQQKERGYPPTIREIGDRFNLHSTGSVRDYLRALEKKGYISRSRHTSRGIGILKKAVEGPSKRIPLLGVIAAGEPILAQENYEEELLLDSQWFRSCENLFALKVKGDSMKDAGILNGDVVIVNKQDHAENGDIVAVLIDGDATVKYYYHEGKKLRFQPANETMSPILVHEGDSQCQLAGKVVGVMRHY